MSHLKNRGKEGRDDLLFGTASSQQKIQEAVTDLSYLLERGFSEKSSLQLVGNRYKLNHRQQRAVQGMSEANSKLELRAKKRVSVAALANQELIIDGFNLLILLESALSDAYLFKGLDGCYRDLSYVHGTYKKVVQTGKAIELVASFLEEHSIKSTTWVFDKPVSNSGRLKTLLRELAEEKGYAWEILLDNNPDKVLASSKKIAVSSDAWILDRAAHWCNLAAYLIEEKLNGQNIINAQ